MKLWNDYGVRANLANVALIGHYIAVLYVIICYDLTYDQVLIIITESAAVALLGLKWYFGKKDDK